MKFKSIIIISLAYLCVSSCTKDLNVSGHAYIVDNNVAVVQVPVSSQLLFLNTGSDTLSYIYQVRTDTIGAFSLPALEKKANYILFTRFIKNNIEYTGSRQFSAGLSDTIILNVKPKYINGMSLTFTDPNNGPIPNLYFRIYLNQSDALVDNVSHAYVNSQTDVNGQFNKFNIPANTYYIMAKDTLALTPLKVIMYSGSVTVTATVVTTPQPPLQLH